jgi:hypothetical protein
MPNERGVSARTGAFARPVLWLLALATITVYLALFLRTCWRIGDEGSIIYGAQRVTLGAIPSRDFFEVMGPGAFYWLALWFKVLGTSWMTSRLEILATALGSAAAIYYSTTRVDRGSFAVIPAGVYTILTVPVWPGANHHFDSNLWILLAFALVVGAPHFSKRVGWAAGVLTGLSATIIPQKGTLMLVAIGAAVAIERAVNRRRSPVSPGIACMVAGFGCVGLSVVLFFWLNGSLHDLVYANAIWPATQYHSVNRLPYAYGIREQLLPQLSSLIEAVLPRISYVAIPAALVPFVVIAALPILVICGAGLQLARSRSADRSWEKLPWTYWVCGISLFVSESHRPDFMHLIYGSPILLIVGVTWLAQTKRALGQRLLRVFIVCVLFVGALLGLIAMTARTPFLTRQGTITLFSHDEALEFLQNDVSAGENVFVYPYCPMYYFLADVRNPTRYSILMYGRNTAEQFEEVIQALDSARVKFVLWDTLVSGDNLRAWFPLYREPPPDQQLLEQYLQSRYKVLGVKHGFRIMQRIEGVVPLASRIASAGDSTREGDSGRGEVPR